MLFLQILLFCVSLISILGDLKTGEPLSLQPNSKEQKENARYISFFTKFRFKPFECSYSGKSGTCLIDSECSEEDGTRLGSCAKGWGVCCQITKRSCHAKILYNSTYIQNPNYPDSEPGPKACCFNVNKVNKNISLLRLDMETNTLAPQTVSKENPKVNGLCETDTMSTTCSKGTRNPDNFCGYNDGQHIYLDVSMEESCEICFNLGYGEYTRIWNIKISQFPHDDVNAPPTGCLQYFTGSYQTFCNIGYSDKDIPHLLNHQYSICIRTEKHKCSITYAASMKLEYPFRVSFAKGLSLVGDLCPYDRIVLPFGKGAEGGAATVYCGERLAAKNKNSLNDPIKTYAQPFTVHYYSNSVQSSTNLNGFCLDYIQNDC